MGRGAVWFSVALGAAPDLDFLPAFVMNLPGNLIPGQVLFHPDWTWLHRGYTHAVSSMVAASIVLGLVGWWFGAGCAGPGRWMLLALAVLLSHTALDLVNNGAFAWLPFSRDIDVRGTLPVVDPLVLLPAGICFLANHPPVVGAWRRFSTLAACEHAGTWLHERLTGKCGSALLARACLALVAVGIVARVLL